MGSPLHAMNYSSLLKGAVNLKRFGTTNLEYSPGVGNLRPVGRIQPAKQNNLAHCSFTKL